MLQVIDAVYEKGIFKPLADVHLPERQKVRLIFVPKGTLSATDDLPAWALAKLAEQSPSFAFLADPREDVYSLNDGEPVS